jgi:hypothetical protein
MAGDIVGVIALPARFAPRPPDMVITASDQGRDSWAQRGRGFLWKETEEATSRIQAFASGIS